MEPLNKEKHSMTLENPWEEEGGCLAVQMWKTPVCSWAARAFQPLRATAHFLHWEKIQSTAPTKTIIKLHFFLA